MDDHRSSSSPQSITMMTMRGQPLQGKGPSWCRDQISNVILVVIMHIKELVNECPMDIRSIPTPYACDTWSDDANFQTSPTLGFCAISILLRKRREKMKMASFKTSTLIVNIYLDG